MKSTINPHIAYNRYAIFFAFCGVVLFSGCGQQTNESHSVVNTLVIDSVAHKDTVATSQAEPVTLTLPMLDALFYEDSFKQELKSKLQLSDAQIAKLKSVSQASVADLDENATNYTGSVRVATKRSNEQLLGILGDQKTNQLAQLVAQRYGNTEMHGMVPIKPNEVPTDTRIVVNIPAYRMDVFQDGNLLKSYRIGIGYPEFPLPIGIRRAETIILNPTWTPPDETWVKGKFRPGERVAAGSKDNPLGPIKIPIGYPNLIHGGKAVAKLGGFASHGCVGLTNAGIQDFAATIAELSGTTLSSDDIQNYGKQKKETKSLKLTKPVAVDLRYETIVAENGSLHVLRDVYERGTNTVDNARRVLNVYGVDYDQLPNAEKNALLRALNEMNRDAQGHAIVENIEDSTANNTQDSGHKEDPTKSAKAKKGNVTSSVVGRRSVVVPIEALESKGYPAPVNLYTGAKSSSSGK